MILVGECGQNIHIAPIMSTKMILDGLYSQLLLERYPMILVESHSQSLLKNVSFLILVESYS